MSLYTDHLTIKDTIQHTRVTHMQDANLTPKYTRLDTTPSKTTNKTYLIGTVDVLTKPFPQADVAVDRIERLGVCSCDDYWYNQSNGPPNGEIDVTEFTECKHLAGWRDD